MNLSLVFLRALLVFSPLFLVTEAHSYFEVESKVDNPEMNGIHFKEHADFTEKWRLITVRYRQDSKEIRMVYANDKAWEGMKSLKPNYADGAMFAKVAFLSESDPSFVSSNMPSGTRRYQFMLKNKKKYASTEGWGYALFTSEGQLFKEDVQAKTMACAACHRVVPERDYVFSRPMQLHYSSNPFPEIKKTEQTAFLFKTRKNANFKGAIQTYLDPKKTEVESLEGDIQKHAFSGTLDETVPVLLDQARRTLKDATLFVNEKNFSLVKNQAGANSCAKGENNYRVVVFFNNTRVRDGELCQ